MTTLGALPPPPRRFGPFLVTAAPEAVREFRRETGWQDLDGPPPASFPVVWLRENAVSDAIRRMAEGFGLPVHESQQFTYVRPLRTGHAYALTFDVTREQNPPRLAILGEIRDRDGALVAQLATMLRLVEARLLDVEAPA